MSQDTESACEHCGGRRWVPAAGQSIEDGTEPCPFCVGDEENCACGEPYCTVWSHDESAQFDGGERHA